MGLGFMAHFNRLCDPLNLHLLDVFLCLTDLDISILVEELHASLEAGEATLAAFYDAQEKLF